MSTAILDENVRLIVQRLYQLGRLDAAKADGRVLLLVNIKGDEPVPSWLQEAVDLRRRELLDPPEGTLEDAYVLCDTYPLLELVQMVVPGATLNHAVSLYDGTYRLIPHGDVDDRDPRDPEVP